MGTRRLSEVALEVPAMGGSLRLRVACAAHARDRARRDLDLAARRVQRWAARLTRFDPGSELSALNERSDAAETPVGPTLAAVLGWATEAARRTEGVVDVGLLDERIAAEDGPDGRRPPGRGRWESGRGRWRSGRGPDGRHGRVWRDGQVRFDLDGLAKGWIADRALGLLDHYPAALVDADGDIAVAIDPRAGWTIGVADPLDPGEDLVSIDPDRVGPRRLGVATSGTHVHRWGDDPHRHHLIDPATGSPAVSDVEQCTVVARSAALAEAIAKAVVIQGSAAGAALLGRAGALGGVLLLRDGEVLATEEVPAWLA